MNVAREEILAALAPLKEAARIENVTIGPDGIRLVVRGAAAEETGLRDLFNAALSRFGQPLRLLLTEEKTESPAARAPAQWNREALPHVKRILAVGSGKGGVGKSTVTVGLAMALSAAGNRVGILDADIYGPSIPRMLGLQGKPAFENGLMLPHVAHGLSAMSIGFLTGDAPAVLRGPMISKTLTQLLRGTKWGTEAEPLDFLLIDLPPGTGDVQLSLAQACPMDGAIIVTTPQNVAVIDARKALLMFGKVGVPVLGIVENMAGFADPASGTVLPMFGKNGGKTLAQEEGVPILGSLPFYPALASALDEGKARLQENDPARAAFRRIAADLL